jgi:hypothetical protein
MRTKLILWTSAGMFIGLIIGVVVAGAAQRRRAPLPPISKRDPVASFRAFSARLVPNLQHEFAKYGPMQKDNEGRAITVGPSYDLDIRRTDSLISPFVGRLRIPEIQKLGPATFQLDYVYDLGFSLRDDRWALTSATEEQHNWGKPIATFDMFANTAVWDERLYIIGKAIASTDPSR